MDEARIVLGSATEEDHNSMLLIQTKITCASQALASIPAGMTTDERRTYTAGCIDALGTYKFLEKQFWLHARKAYADIFGDKDFDKIYLDLDSGVFYTH